MTARTRVELEPAYILHTRAYRETSQLLDVITPGYGRVGIIANGARRPKSAFRGYLNPFQPLRLSWTGRSELVRLQTVESFGPAAVLGSEQVLAGFYANELLIKLLHRGDAHADLFAHYTALIAELAGGQDIEKMLRGFEMELLTEIGYAMDLRSDCIAHLPLEADKYYEFEIERGLVPVAARRSDGLVYSGSEYAAIAQLDFSSSDIRRSAKRLLRTVLNFHLGGRPLRTREVAAAMKR